MLFVACVCVFFRGALAAGAAVVVGFFAPLHCVCVCVWVFSFIIRYYSRDLHSTNVCVYCKCRPFSMCDINVIDDWGLHFNRLFTDLIDYVCVSADGFLLFSFIIIYFCSRNTNLYIFFFILLDLLFHGLKIIIRTAATVIGWLLLWMTTWSPLDPL